MEVIHINIFGSHFKVSSNNYDIVSRLSLDFAKFLVLNQVEEPSLNSIEILTQAPPWELLPKKVALKQNDTSIIYEENGIRYNDYYCKALSIVDSNNKTSTIYSADIDLAHELGFLLILSKSGKRMDLHGLHKIHAMGVQFSNTNLLFMASSKVGKSSLFLEFLKDPTVKFYSDDTPVINSQGEILPFPFRIGINNKEEAPDYINQEDIYTLQRRSHGQKYLIPLNAIDRNIAQYQKGQRSILIVGIRTLGEARIYPISPFAMLKHLQKHMIIGVGLPMVLEYFLESGLKDILKRFIIILKRTKAAVSLILQSECYLLESGPDIKYNCELIKKKVLNQ